ncbi:GD13108 [Drosophila simulans]|uniref:GD13108 n=1 Tax=Drosophila simulans TaxID=7240 RepID=B4QJU0_DROSI|nr:GD13108 [Drosophila simulans]
MLQEEDEVEDEDADADEVHRIEKPRRHWVSVLVSLLAFSWLKTEESNQAIGCAGCLGKFG